MIDAEELTRRYGETLAVDSVSFSIGGGEIVGLLGHNGAGKTTIMKMLTGYLEPSAGRVRVDGYDVADEPEAVQQRLGYLPENCPVYPEMTVVEYLDYVSGLRGVADSAAAIREVLAATDLTGRAFDPIGTLSRGYQQRVGVAQAIVHKPQLLILDEPTNGLDPSQTQQMRNLILRLAENATVILSTHIMQEVDAVCDRVMILRAGKLALGRTADGTAAQRTDGAPDRRRASGRRRGGGRICSRHPLTTAAMPSTVSPTTRAVRSWRAAWSARASPCTAWRRQKRDLETVFREVSTESQ